MKKLSTRQLAFAALGTAMIAVCSWISITLTPSLVPFTLQTFAICLISALFGWRLGILTVGAYILLGAFGMPVFAGFKGGISALLGTTGGYIVGFLFTAAVVGYAAERFGRKIFPLAVSMVIGIALCYAFGTAWFVIVYARVSGPVGIGTALAWCVIPYIIPDALKIFLACLLSGRLYPLISKGIVYAEK